MRQLFRAGIGVMVVCAWAGCSDAPTAEAPEVEAVTDEETASPVAAVATDSTDSKDDALLAALEAAAENNDPLPVAKDEKDKKKIEVARVAQAALDLTEALKASALRARVDGNGKPIVLDFHGRYLTDQGLAKLKGQITLQQLFLNRQQGITDIGLEHLKGLTALRTLHLSETPIGDSNLEALATLKALQQLDLWEPKSVRLDWNTSSL